MLDDSGADVKRRFLEVRLWQRPVVEVEDEEEEQALLLPEIEAPPLYPCPEGTLRASFLSFPKPSLRPRQKWRGRQGLSENTVGFKCLESAVGTGRFIVGIQHQWGCEKNEGCECQTVVAVLE